MIGTITLPREVVERLVASWGRDTKAFIDSMDTLRTHLAAEQPKPSEVAELIENLMHHAYNDGVKQLKYRSSQTVEAEEALRTALAAPPESEALRREAERYRWMKREVKRIPPAWDLVGWDAAIDAAMKEGT